MKSFHIIASGAVLLLALGCDTQGRLSRLDKQNQELQEKIKNDRTTADYDLGAKCSRDARAWFKENWSQDKGTIVLDYRNHYSNALNKCFILVEYHFRSGQGSSWANVMTLWDVYENFKYGNFSENHMLLKPDSKPEERIASCEVLDKQCKTQEEFNELIRPYLNN